MLKPLFANANGIKPRGHVIDYDYFRKPYQIQHECVPPDIAPPSLSIIQLNGLVFNRQFTEEETKAMFDSIDAGWPNADVALFIFGVLNECKQTNISVCSFGDAEPVDGILYAYTPAHVTVTRDAAESIDVDSATLAIQVACIAALGVRSLASISGKSNALEIMRDILVEIMPRRAVFGPLTFNDPYAHLADFARFLFNPSRNAMDYKREHKQQLIELYTADQAMLKEAVRKANTGGDTEAAEAKIRTIFKEHAQVQQFLIKAIREVDNATLSCPLHDAKDSIAFNTFFRIVYPLCR